ncbi:hypothetical protein [Clostridium manihotivorum]|uniref:Nucleoside 2-deoxyribosyltransferase n=1 Tax=Clostridium manihotivorum TaxID=2320868 RepID=A0A3R5QWM3_9CLOT|nr:hypothetical protein [Clostridium manihotivorum]QAA31238.1 hypothetical protein C1I91_06030 [Clostridium manihotivorum]
MTSKNEKIKEVLEKEIIEEEECFVIMPISDPDGYKTGHFKMVYDDIFKKAIIDAGFKPYRADDSKSGNMIQIDIVKRIIEAPMAICDLSSKNPNVLFELGIRQAFDKPVLLVQEVGNGRIFDINTINTYEYKKECIYSEVLNDQREISSMLKATYESHSKGVGINSLIRLINISPAVYNTTGKVDSDEMLKVIFSEISGLKNEFSRNRRSLNMNKHSYSYVEIEDEARSLLQSIKNVDDSKKYLPIDIYKKNAELILSRCEKFLNKYENEARNLGSTQINNLFADIRLESMGLQIDLIPNYVIQNELEIDDDI